MVQIVVSSYLWVVVSRVLGGVGAMGTMAPTFYEDMPFGTHTFGKESY